MLRANIWQRLAGLEKQSRRIEAEAASRAGLDLYVSTSPRADGIRRHHVTESTIDENARDKAKAFTSQPKAILLMNSDDGLLIACSPDSGANAGALLTGTLAKAGARGGGSATLAQGSLPDASILTQLLEDLGF